MGSLANRLIPQARRKVSELFRKHQHHKDQAIIEILVGKGYMELEETVMQYKQRTHLIKLLGGTPPPYRKPLSFPKEEPLAARHSQSTSPNRMH